MQPWKNDRDPRSARLLFAATLTICTIGCEFKLESPPEGPIVEGPTLSTEITTVSESSVTDGQLLASALLDEDAQAAHGDFLAANADKIGSGRFVAVTGARVSLRPGPGVDDLADALVGVMVFVAPEGDATSRVFLASGVAPADDGPLVLGLTANQLDYERAQPALAAPRFLVGVSGPTSLATDRVVEFGLQVDLDLAIIGELDD